MPNEALFPSKLKFLFRPKRFKIAKGGRLGGKSWGFARALIILGRQKKLRILCTRETQKSIADSVHHLLSEQIKLLGMEDFYRVQETSIKGANGTEFIFAGIRQQNVVNLKSFEDVDVCWVEEAQVVTKRSWDVLIPTIRKQGSEVWVSFNPDLDSDETYRRFVLDPFPSDMQETVTINYGDNPFLSETSKRDIEIAKTKDPDSFDHIYLGACRQVVEGAVYRTELLAVDRESRIRRVPYDPSKPVDTFWDLGWGDHTSIWFTQSIGFELRLIDFLDGSQQSLHYYLKALQDRGYLYGRICLPHDAKAHELGSGRSIEEQVRSVYKDRVEIVRKLSIEDGIAAARAIFPKCWFDAEKCETGLRALRSYRYERDDKLQTLKKEPLHDWASHAADAFRYFAVAVKEPQRQQAEAMQDRTWQSLGDQAWMA